MGLSVTHKILKSHLKSGNLKAKNEISIHIDQTLTQDSTGTLAYLQFESMGIAKVKTKKSVAYIDHNTLQTGFENADDHNYIKTVALKHGVHFSKPGNGICHQVHLERFGIPGMTLLGSDSHTPTCGGIGMIAIGAGGLDVAVAMGGGEYFFNNPEIINIKLIGELKKGVSAKDVILEVLRVLTVKGGVGKVIEYTGDGIKNLSVPQRATITNMGAELGATTSVFPSDEITYEFLKAQGRESDFIEILPDGDAKYDQVINIDLAVLSSLVAKPHSPDNIEEVSKVGKIRVDQVAIGSCTNSSYMDLMNVSRILNGKKVHDDVSLVIAPGSKQVLRMLSDNGALSILIGAGARILESACGPCIGMGQSPSTDAVSLRTFNRNFEGRSGTKSAQVYLVSPEVAAFSAINGYLTNPQDNLDYEEEKRPKRFLIDDSMVIVPSLEHSNIHIIRGPNIKPFPINTPINGEVKGTTLIKLGDNITTDDIMPSNSKLLPYRSNIPYLSKFCLAPCDEEFSNRAVQANGGFIVAGENYGQGSSREHAALVPLYLKVKGVFAKSFARIHMNNLINSGIIPMTFVNEKDYEIINQNDELLIQSLNQDFDINKNLIIFNKTQDINFEVKLLVSQRQFNILLEGGLLNYTKTNAK